MLIPDSEFVYRQPTTFILWLSLLSIMESQHHVGMLPRGSTQPA